MSELDDWGTPWWREHECSAWELDLEGIDYLTWRSPTGNPSIDIWVALPSGPSPRRHWRLSFEDAVLESLNHIEVSHVPRENQMEIHRFEMEELDGDAKVLVQLESIPIDSLVFTSTRVTITELQDDEDPSRALDLKGDAEVLYPPTGPSRTPREARLRQRKTGEVPPQ